MKKFISFVFLIALCALLSAGTPGYLTLASTIINGAGETNWLTNTLSPSALLTGWNTLAAEVHQSTNTSSDVGFDFELSGVARLSDPPAVNATQSAANFTVMWPAEGSYFTLHCATNFAAPVTWARVTNAAILSNGQWRVTLPLATNGSRFYRLQAP